MYGDLSKNLGNLKEDNNLVEFFKAVLDRRDGLDTLGGASSVFGLPGLQKVSQ